MSSVPLVGWAREGSPYHPGEQAVQARAGARDLAERLGRKVIRDFMPDQHRTFFAELPFLIIGSLDAEGQPWASILFGQPGFAGSPDSRRLEIAATPVPGDPLRNNLRPGSPLGVLGIQLETRRRNRMNGKLIDMRDGRFAVAVDQSFGNCPQYIQVRQSTFVAERSPGEEPPPVRSEGKTLSAEAVELVRSADTFFIASASPAAGEDDPIEGVDVSHRGGRPGFVDVREEHGRTVLVAPDFVGNSAYSTFGNLLLNPRAGLLFVDFEAGHLLMLAGEGEAVWDSPEMRAFPGAERLLRFRVREGLFLERAAPLRWSAPEYAPQIAATGTWDEVSPQSEASYRADAYRPLTVSRIDQEGDTTRHLHLEPLDGSGPAPHRPGQFLPIAVDVAGEGRLMRRTYTISNAPDGRRYRLTVKRSAAGSPASVSNWLHDEVRPGAVIHALAPRGDFVLNPDSRRTIVLLSAGIGVTPMIAMLDHLTGGLDGRSRRPDRRIFFIHAARSGGQHAFREYVRELAQRRPNLTVHVRYSQPRPSDVLGRDHDSSGHIDRALLQSLLPLDDYDVYLCGPEGFMREAHALLTGLGISDRRIRAEAFGPSSLGRLTDGEGGARPLPAAAAEAEVTFRRSGVRSSWNPSKGTLLDLAEAMSIEAPWSCRNGVCGTCAAGLAQGAVTYEEMPSARCPENKALLCSAVPASDELVLDL